MAAIEFITPHTITSPAEGSDQTVDVGAAGENIISGLGFTPNGVFGYYRRAITTATANSDTRFMHGASTDAHNWKAYTNTNTTARCWEPFICGLQDAGSGVYNFKYYFQSTANASPELKITGFCNPNDWYSPNKRAKPANEYELPALLLRHLTARLSIRE